MYQHSREPKYIAAESLLTTALAECDDAPQPEGAVVADAYRDGRLQDHSTQLHVIAYLLRRVDGEMGGDKKDPQK